MNIDVLSEAIRALGGTKFSVRDIDNINFTDGNSKNITKDQIKAKYDELLIIHNSKQYQRDRADAYPDLKEQLDMQYWDAVNGTNKWQEAVAKVKTDNPKPE